MPLPLYQIYMKSNFATTAAAVAVIGAGAFLAGRSSASNGSDKAVAMGKEGSVSSRASGSAASGRESGGRASRLGSSGRSSSAAQAGTKEERLAKLESIIRGDDPIARNRAFLAYLDQLDPSELKDAVDKFRSLGITDERFSEYSMLLTLWAKSDPTAALAYAKENTRGGFATNAILSAWAANDPEAAIRWAKANHQGEDANPYMAGIIKGIASTDPARATQLLAEMPFGEQRGEALAGLLPHILSQGNAATREWIASISDERLRNGAMGRVAEELAATDPKGTADWLLANPGEASLRNMDNVISTWMEKDKSAAMAYYQALPAGETRTNALRGVVNSLAMENPKEAANFMDNHPADVNDRVVQQFVWHSFGEDPSLAISYISKISDSDARDNIYRRTIDGWLRQDEPAARSWLQTNQLPPSVQEHVQSSLLKLNQK
jgi:hypothetical protein